MSEDLLELSDWLATAGCTHVAMESTEGFYWKPIYNLLEGAFTPLLVNARHIKAVPGRKTDVKECEWIAELLRHGLLRGSFVPERPQRELQELSRYRTALVRERAAEVGRLQKTLEGANIKLASVATDIMGKSARQMLKALIDGSTDTSAMAQLARGKLRAKIPQLEQALRGCFEAHQRFLVAQQLAHIDFLEETIERLSAQIAERVGPFEEAIERLETIPGVGRRTAEAILAEIGPEVSRFPTYRHLASWAGMCVRATTRARASAEAGRPPRAIPGCGQPLWRRRTPPVVQRTPTCRRSIAGSRPVGARRRPLWPSVTPFWSSPIVYSSARVAMRS
jgi:transposase